MCLHLSCMFLYCFFVLSNLTIFPLFLFLTHPCFSHRTPFTKYFLSSEHAHTHPSFNSLPLYSNTYDLSLSPLITHPSSLHPTTFTQYFLLSEHSQSNWTCPHFTPILSHFVLHTAFAFSHTYTLLTTPLFTAPNTLLCNLSTVHMKITALNSFTALNSLHLYFFIFLYHCTMLV